LNFPISARIFVSVEQIIAEVQEYAVQLAEKKRLAEDLVLLAVGALPVKIVARTEYKASIAEAEKRIAKRDPDDVDLLALAIALGVPVWSNDRDFKGTGVEWLTTEALLKRLGPIETS
jgi:predicted nucleic acid-binding protein